jgi:hypothetical protein
MICGMCSAPISFTRRLCGPCLNRAHLPGCPRDCSCGFSKLFWADVDAQVAAMPADFDLGFACGARPPEIRRSTDDSGRDGGTPAYRQAGDSGALPSGAGGWL